MTAPAKGRCPTCGDTVAIIWQGNAPYFVHHGDIRRRFDSHPLPPCYGGGRVFDLARRGTTMFDN